MATRGGHGGAAYCTLRVTPLRNKVLMLKSIEIKEEEEHHCSSSLLLSPP